MFLLQQAARFRIYDFAVGIIDGNLVALLLLVFHVLHVRYSQLCDVVLLLYLEHVLDFLLHLVSIEQFAHQFHLHVVGRIAQRDATVSVGIQRVRGNLQTCRDILQHDVPDAVDVGGHLFTVSIAHLVGGHHLRGTLVLAHLAELVFHAELGQQVFQEIRLCSQTVPVNHALRVQIDLVGHTTYIIGGLGIGVSVCHNPLATLLEIEQCLADGMCRCRSISREHAGFYVNSLDVFLFLGLLYGADNVVQSDGICYCSACQHVQRIVFGAFLDLSCQHQCQHGVVGYFHRAARGCRHADERHDGEEKHNC